MPSQVRKRILPVTGAMTPSPERWPCPPSERRRSHISGTTARKKRKTNVFESDDDVDVGDIDNDALPAELGECSMGNDGFDSPPGLQLTGHASRAGGDKKKH